MVIDPAPPDFQGDDAEHLLLDELSERLDTLRLFTVKDESKANDVLEHFGSQGPVEDQMLRELSSNAPLRHPDRFEEAHRGAMRAIEVFETARKQMEGLIPDLSRNTTGLPAFLVGGAAISGTISLVQRGLNDEVGRVAVAGLFVVNAITSFWCVLRAAALARRRTRIALDASLKALWETIGDAGSPPQDQSRMFATIAAILLGLVWIVLPILVALVVALTKL